MSKVSVVYWSQSGNTQAMAEAVGKGAADAGAEVSVVYVGDASVNDLKDGKAFALGCPARGAEVREESDGWGDGQWMRDWEDRMRGAGATISGGEGVICQETPDADAIAACEALGKALAAV